MSRFIDAEKYAKVLKEVSKRQGYDELFSDNLLSVGDVFDAIIADLEGTSRDAPKDAPTADVVEVRHGEWLYYHGDDVQGFYGHPYCSECYGYAPFKADGSAAISPFCPNCGATMDGGT